MQITINLRPAKADDFKNFDGTKKMGTMFFYQSVTGAIETTPQFFGTDTNTTIFKELFNKNQVYVAERFMDN